MAKVSTPAAITAKNFRTVLTSLKNAQLSARDRFQDVLEFAFSEYVKVGSDGKPCGNTVFLTEAYGMVLGVKSMPAKNIAEYIKAHANVRLEQDKKDKTVWRFKKATKGEEASVKAPSVKWYEFSHNREVKSLEADYAKMFQRLLLKAVKAAEEGKVKAGQAEIIAEIRSALGTILDPKRLESLKA
jgi:hypothetical protein